MSSIVGSWEVVSPGSGNPPQIFVFSEGPAGMEAVASQSTNGSTISNIRIVGDTVEFDNRIARPVPLTLHVVVHVEGDAFSGTVKARFIPERQIVGRRVG